MSKNISKAKKQEYNRKYLEKKKLELENLRKISTEEKKTEIIVPQQITQQVHEPIMRGVFQQVLTTLILGSITMVPRLINFGLQRRAQSGQALPQQHTMQQEASISLANL